MFKFAEPGEPTTISDKQWCFPKTFIVGSLLAVIGSPSNSKQLVSDQLVVTVMGKHFKINELWGRAELVRKAMEPPIAKAALNLAPFGRWTLRDKAAQRRLAQR